MKTHISIVGIIFALLGALQVLGAALVGLFGVGGGMLAAIAGGEGSGFAGALIGVLGVGIALFLAFFGFVTLMAGYGTLSRKSWGRWLAVVLSVLHVLSFSWMSLFGIYGLWALLAGNSGREFS